MTTPTGDVRAEIDELRHRLALLERSAAVPAEAARARRGRRLRGLGLGGAGCLLLASGLLHGQDIGEALALFIDPRGWVGIGTQSPQARLDVAGTLQVRGDAALAGAEVRQTLAVQGAAQLAQANVAGALTVGGPLAVGGTASLAELDVAGVVRARVVEATTPMQHRMYPADPLVHQDIFAAMQQGVVAKLGTPAYDDLSYAGAKDWYGRNIVKFGGNNEADGNGAKVVVPPGYDTVWIRVLGDRWNAVHAYFLDGKLEDLGLWTGGHRAANNYAPDGGLADGHYQRHQWIPIAAGRAGELALVSKPGTDSSFWLSGIAFSRNPWSHAVQAAVGYHWRVNGGQATSYAAGWHDWNGDALSRIDAGSKLELRVPVVASGRDKLLYLVEHNNNWNGAMHGRITVDGQEIERFTATYDNPFARHWNSKSFNRYIAARIPAERIPADARYLGVVIDMGLQDNGIHFREIGTHDLEVPWERPATATPSAPASAGR